MEAPDKFEQLVNDAVYACAILRNDDGQFELADVSQLPLRTDTALKLSRRGLYFSGIVAITKTGQPRVALDVELTPEQQTPIVREFVRRIEAGMNWMERAFLMPDNRCVN
jgi:hypothetical protein